MTTPTQKPATRCTQRTLAAVLTSGLLAAAAQAGTLEVLVVDRDGKPVPDAVVMALPSAPGAVAKRALPMSATVNQEKMQFVPSVSIVAPGARVRFTNSDAWDHHVKLTAPGNLVSAASSSADGTSLRLEGKTEGKPASSTTLTLEKPGATGAVLLGCFIHGSMSGHIYVAESPWTVKTDANGIAVIDDVPDGAATIRVWQALQVVEKTPQSAVIGATATKITFQLDVVPRRRRG